MAYLLHYQMLRRSQLEASELRAESKRFKQRIMELEQELEIAREEAQAATPPSDSPKKEMDHLRVALRKFAGLYELFPPDDILFYRDIECPCDANYINDYYIRYQDENSENLGLLGELYSVIPPGFEECIVDADKAFVKLVCHQFILQYFHI
jgi:hypothetical protein